MAYSKIQMTKVLAKLEWRLDSIILNVKNWTKEETENQLKAYRTDLIKIQAEYEKPNTRKPKDDEAEKNEQEGEPPELPEQGEPNA